MSTEILTIKVKWFGSVQQPVSDKRCELFSLFEVSFGDVVFHGDAAGQVLHCLEEQGALYVVVQQLQFLEVVSAHSAKWIALEGSSLWAAEGLSPSTAWYTSPDGVTVVIRE